MKRNEGEVREATAEMPDLAGGETPQQMTHRGDVALSGTDAEIAGDLYGVHLSWMIITIVE